MDSKDNGYMQMYVPYEVTQKEEKAIDLAYEETQSEKETILAVSDNSTFAQSQNSILRELALQLMPVWVQSI